MKIYAPFDLGVIIKMVNAKFAEEKLEDNVSLRLHNDLLVLKLSKFGKSTITFRWETKPDGTYFYLVSEELSFLHKPFRDEIIEKLTKEVISRGGSVS